MIVVSPVPEVPTFKMYKLHRLVNNLEMWELTKLLKGRIFQKEMSSLTILPYFFGYKLEIFSFQNNYKNLDPFGIV